MYRSLPAALMWLLGCISPPQIPDLSASGTVTGEPAETTLMAGESYDSTSSTSTSSSNEGSTASSSSAMDASSTGADSAGESTSTGTPSPSCGNGQLDPQEECEGEISSTAETAGCHLCRRDRRIFASATMIHPGDLKGLFNADSRCKIYAAMATQWDPEGLPNAKRFIAWLSDSKQQIRDREPLADARYVRTDGVLVAESLAELLSGTLRAPIDHDEHGQLITEGAKSVWTGTTYEGLRAPGSDHCQDWSSSAQSAYGHIGSISATDESWTLITNPVANPTTCDSGYRIYCLERGL